MPQPPAGAVTFLFTDIEGSTRLWEQRPDAMRPVLARHDQLLREAIESRGGWVFKTVGDAFCAAFAAAPPALASALAAQQAMEAESWAEGLRLRVRMALHTGPAEEREGDYFGPALNRVARLLAAGHGGQALLSSAVQALTRDHLPPGVSFLDLGERRLKDLAGPEQVFQLLHPALPSEFPPLKSLDNPDLPNNLPQQTTSFVGRAQEVAEVKALLNRTRLLTLTGAGGSGKTRLALRAAADLRDRYFDGVWLVELAPLSERSLVPQAVADALGVQETAGRTVLQSLVEWLRPKRLLLALDNCEHLVSACAALVADLLRLCPGVHVLATSREPLGVAGEQTYRVPSLSLPDPKQSQTVESLSQYESVSLFRERAQAVQTAFAVTELNAPAVAQVCFHLDGIPLAIELAAARIRSLSVEEVSARLDSRFRLLTGGSRSALPRQQTLRALIDWSYDLLTEQEKAALCRLSVFAGGWTLSAAEAVCADDEAEEWEVLDLLTALADKSLVIADPRGSSTRYRLLETVRQYGADRLAERGESAVVAKRHAERFLGLAEQAEPLLTGPEQASWLSSLETEHDNLRAALAWYLRPEGGDEAENTESGLRLSGALWRLWWLHGHHSEGRQWLKRALERAFPAAASNAPRAQAARARALNGAGNLAYSQSDYSEARILYEESLMLCQQIGDRQGTANSLSNLGSLTFSQGELASAQTLYESSLTLYRQLENTLGIAFSLNSLGVVATSLGQYPRARVLFEEGLALRRQLGDHLGIANSLGNLADNAAARGDYAVARTLYEESLMLRRQIGDQQGIAFALLGLGAVAHLQRDSLSAAALYRESITVFQRLGDLYGVASGLESLAGAEFGLNQAGRAARILGAAAALRDAIGSPLDPVEQKTHDRLTASARAALGEAAFDAAWAEGAALPGKDAVEYALAEEQTPGG